MMTVIKTLSQIELRKKLNTNFYPKIQHHVQGVTLRYHSVYELGRGADVLLH